MAKARTSPATKKAHKSNTCKRATIKFTTKRGKTIEFAGRAGKTCGPRPKPRTGHLNPYKKIFKAAAKSCKGASRGKFLKCMKANTKGVLPMR